MKVTKEKIVEIYTPVVNSIIAVNSELEKVNAVLDINSDFIASVFRLYDIAIQTAQTAVGDNWDQLNWFIYENECGDAKSIISCDGKDYMISSLEDLAEWIMIDVKDEEGRENHA